MLLECATGKYPYDATAGPLVLMMQVFLFPIDFSSGPYISLSESPQLLHTRLGICHSMIPAMQHTGK